MNSTARGARPALVLSGGGTRMSFQVGALRYLYETTEFCPSVITATSAGAIIAAALAQGSTQEQQLAGLHQLTSHLTRITALGDLFVPTPLADRLRDPLAKDELSEILGMSHPLTPGIDPMHTVALARSLSLLDLVSSEISDEGRRHQSVFTPGPALQGLVGSSAPTGEPLATAGVQLRLTMISLESGDLHYATETGGIVDRHGEAIAPPGTVSLGEAVLASCSLPGFLPPVQINGEHYLDGGLREFLPVVAAAELADCEEVVAISTRPVGTGRLGSFAGAGIVEIMSRMYGDVSADEIQRDELIYAHERDVRVIQSLAPVHSAFEFDPLLILLSVDDGWMAAAAATTGADPTVAVHLTDLRRHLALAHATQAGTVQIDQARAELSEAMAAAPQGLLPPHQDSWLLSPEELAALNSQYASDEDNPAVAARQPSH